MKKTNFFSLAFRPLLCLSLIGLTSTPLQAQTTLKYTYDALGRVTFVEDPTNGNRDYDYDKAGNRLLVTTNISTDAGAEPAPPVTMPAPTGLSCSQYAPGAWKGSWSAVTGASYYIYRTTSVEVGSETTETDTSTVKTASCKWVQACNSANICSAKAYF